MEFRARCQRAAEWFCSHPFFGAGTAFAAVLAGGCASLFTTDIVLDLKTLVPEAYLSYGGAVFWGALILAFVLFWMNQAAISSRANRAKVELDLAVRRLNTLPSETFLPNYQKYWKEVSALTMACLSAGGRGELSVKDVEDSIKSVLLGILEAAKDYDGVNNRVSYAANVMFWRDNGIGLENPNAIDLAEMGKDEREFAGLLELVPSLSIVSPWSEGGDTKTDSIVLPVPKVRENFVSDSGAELLVLLPGAPHTFVTGDRSIFPTVQKFVDVLKNGTTLDARVTRRMADYFVKGNGKHIRSFASFAILTVPSEGELPIGVLNIHSESVGLLEDNGDTLFSPLLEPFLTMLAVLLSLRTGLLSKRDGEGAKTGE